MQQLAVSEKGACTFVYLTFLSTSSLQTSTVWIVLLLTARSFGVYNSGIIRGDARSVVDVLQSWQHLSCGRSFRCPLPLPHLSDHCWLMSIDKEQRSSRIHLVMVGRPQLIDEISEALEDFVPTIHVDWRKNSADIIHYVENSIRKSKVLNRAPKSLQDEIVDTIARNANGMFMWVDLMMRELSKKTRASSIRESLHHAPKGLTEMLRHVLEGFSSTLKEEDPDDLNTMLKWVTCAIRPLSLEELDTILKLKSPEGDGVFYLEGKLRKQFASFFSLTREDGLSTADLQGDTGARYGPEKGEDGGDEEEGLEDVDNETEFNSNPSTTDVTFCHASIGDFFRDVREGKVSAGVGSPAIGVNIIEAKISVLKACLDIVCDTSSSAKGENPSSMESYASKLWHEHLEAAAGDLAKFDAADKIGVGRHLVKMFHDETVISGWTSERGCLFYTAETLKPLRQWLEDKEVLDSLPTKDQEWVQATSQNPADMFVPVIKLLGKKWLQDISWIPSPCMGSIYIITSLMRGEPVDSLPDNIPLQVILDAAEWCQFEKTSLWHRRLAMCLRDYEHYEEAMEHFETSLNMEQNMWRARGGMILLHFNRQEYDKAIELGLIQERVIQNLLDQQNNQNESDFEHVDMEDLSVAQSEIAESYGKLGDHHHSLEYYQKAFKAWNRHYGEVLECVRILGRVQEEKDHEGIISLLKSMEDEVTGEDYTRLTECISQFMWSDEDFFILCAKAAKKTNQLAWLQEAYKTAISEARKKLKPVLAITLEVCLAELYSTNGDEEEKAARLWEKIVDYATAGGTENWQLSYCKNLVVKRFSNFCFQKALDAGQGTLEADNHIKKLEKSCKQKTKATTDATEVITTNYSAIFLGLWYRLNGQDEEARACFQPYIKEAVMILSDDDPDNDITGYYDLAHVLLAAGDEVNAMAVFHVLKPYKKTNKAEVDDEEPGQNESRATAEKPEFTGTEGNEAKEKSSGEVNQTKMEEKPNTAGKDEATSKDIIAAAREAFPEEEFLYPWYCDGPCERQFPSYSYAYVCRYCLCDFCEDCLNVVKNDTLEIKVCNIRHEWLYVSPPKQTVGENEIIVGDVVMTLEDFKDSLRKEWHV